MENTSAETMKRDMKNESGQVERDCLRSSLILRTILQHFSTTELLKLSLVSKLWNYEARSLLRNRGTITTTVNIYENCQHLRAFASDLRQLKENAQLIPISGVTINLGGLDCVIGGCDHNQTHSEFEQACEDILDQLTWKHLSVKICGSWTVELINCPGLLLMTKILENFGHILQEFALELPRRHGDLIYHLIQRCCTSFPPLNTLKIKDKNGLNTGCCTSLMKSLVSQAPNLRVLHTDGYINLSANLLGGSTAVHVSDYPFSPLRNEIPEGAIGPLRMTKMLLMDVCEGLVLERFNRITTGLLESSRRTLTMMTLDALYLAPLTTYGICLENLATLEINLEQQKLETMYPLVMSRAPRY